MLRSHMVVEVDYSPFSQVSTLSKLHKAVLTGDPRKVRAEIRAGADINQYEPELGATPIFVAALKGYLQIAKELVQAGANINIKAADQMTPLLCGVHCRKVEMVKFLLDKGADISARIIGYDSGLHIAAKENSVDIARLLIDRGLDVNGRNSQDEAALHMAVACGNIEMVKLLLWKDADVNASACGSSVDGWDYKDMGFNFTPLLLSSIFGNLCIADMLIEAGANVNVVTSERYTTLHSAAQSGQLKLVNLLLKEGADVNGRTSSNQTPLYFATVKGHTKIVATLLVVSGVDIVMADGKDNLLLIAAAKGHLEIVKLLIANGHPIDGPSFPTKTPLHMALSFGHEDVVEFLIEKGADIHVLDSFSGTTPLGHTCRLCGFLPKSAKLLIAKGADINAKSSDGATPLHLMVQSKDEPVEYVKYFVEHGANPDARHNNGFTPLHYAILAGNAKIVKYLVTKVVDIDAISFVLGTPLHVAVFQGNDEIVEILLKNGANVNALEKTVGSPLCIAALKGQYKIAEMLLKHKAAVSLEGKIKGSMPLFLAVEKQNVKLVKLLLDYGADVDANAINEFGTWPIHMAAGAGNVDMARALLEKGAYFDIAAIGKNSPGSPIKIVRSTANEALVTLFELIEKLFNAVIKNDMQLIKCCIQAGAIINARNASGRTVLHYAVNNENIEAVNILLASGADIGYVSNIGNSPIHIAVEKRSVEIVEFLLMHSKKLSFSKCNHVLNTKTTEGGATVLHFATRNNSFNIAQLLIQNGAVYNTKNKLDKMPLQLTMDEEVKKLLDSAEKLFQAVEKNSLEEVVQILKNNKSAVNARDANGGGTPLYWAVSKGHTDIANHLLINDADYCLVTNKGTTSLHIAASKGNVEVVKTLVRRVKNSNLEKVNSFIDAQTASGTTALHVASSLDVVKCLLEAGATYNILNGGGKTPLQVTKNYDVLKLLRTTHELFKNVEKGVSAVFNILNSLEAEEFNAVTSARNEQGQILTEAAVASGHVKMASKLLQKLKNLS